MASHRYMHKSYRCTVCFKSFNTLKQAEKHWREQHGEAA